MNVKMVLNTIGKIMIALSFLLLLPTAVTVIYKEACLTAFLITISISLIIGLLLTLCIKPLKTEMYAKEGFVIVSASWILFSLIGALPFYLSGEIKHYIDAIFEVVSGLTTTGASILNDVEALSKGLLFWRSFTNWIGGMGVLVFIMAISPGASDRSLHIMRAEMPGPIVGKLVPKAKETAKLLYIIYIVLTLTEAIILICGGQSLYESLVLSFSTAGTGGFTIKSDGIAGYSAFVQWTITVFMTLFGINFNLFFLILIKRFKLAICSSELWTYLIILFISTALITYNTFSLFNNNLSEAIRHSAFQASSIITTTGFSTVDFNNWPSLSKAILLILMFIGGCAGSTAGGLKVSRLIILFKTIKNEISKMLHPRSVNTIKFEGKTLDNTTISNVSTYVSVYVFGIIIFFLLLSINGLDFETNFTATLTCFNNVGPGLSLVRPYGNFDCFSYFSKIILSLAMLFGRLEIFPMLLFFNPRTWVRTK